MDDKGKLIFASAKMYSAAAHKLNDTSNCDPSMLIPSMVNAALALELYFKSLYVLERNEEFKLNGRYSHDFASLFDELSESTRREFIDGFNNVLAARDMNDVETFERDYKMRVPRDFKSNLAEWSTVFTRVRYVYEFKSKPNGSQKSMMFFPEIEKLAMDVILKRKPQWAIS